MLMNFAVNRRPKKAIKTKNFSKSMSVLALSMLLCLSACQRNNTSNQEAQTATDESVAVQEATPTPEALAAIEKYQPIYVTQVINLQHSLQAEYEALQVADVPISISKAGANKKDNETVKTLKDVKSMQHTQDSNDPAMPANSSDADNDQTSDNSSDDSTSIDSDSIDSTSIDSTSIDSAIDEIVQSAATTLTPKLSVEEVLAAQKNNHVQLPLASTVITPPEILTQQQIKKRYQSAMHDLYSANDVALSAQTVDTLLSIAMLVPDVFENAELAERLTIKMPSLARLLQQYQIWEQIEAQQSAELEAIKQAQVLEQQQQKQNFEKLMEEFNKTIAGYDEQIEKYEQKLKEFE